MMKTLVKRVLLLIATLLLVTILAFVAFSIIPGDPTSSILGVEATPEQIAALRDRLGLDLPIWQRYLHWLGGLLTGDLGESYNYGMPVAQLLATCVTHTLTLAVLAFVLIVAISLPLGIIAARYEGGVVDRVLTILNQITMSVPNFVAGILLVYVFGLVLRLFQPPALAVALPRSAMTVKMLRGAILSELGQDYIRTAYSKGNSKSSALWRHVLRNAMIPVVTFLAMTVADIMAGSIVVEQVFGIPGLGKMLVTSIGNRDYPVVQAGCYGNYIGMLKYTVDTTSMRIVCAEPRLVAVKAPQRLSPKARRLQAQIDELLATTLTPGGTPIGTRLTVARKNIVHNRDNRYRQTSIGQWVCTAFATSFRQAAGMNNDTAIIGVSHIGSIRTGFAKGNVSVIDVGEVLPFANPLRVYRLNGSQLKELVRFGLSNLQYGYMQMAGVEVEKDRKGQVDALFYVSPDGKRKKIGAKDYCYLVADEFMTNGGDGYAPELFPASQEVKDVVLPSTTDAFINFLKTVPYLDE